MHKFKINQLVRHRLNRRWGIGIVVALPKYDETYQVKWAFSSTHLSHFPENLAPAVNPNEIWKELNEA